MTQEKEVLYERLNKAKDNEDYIPVVQNTKDFYMILGGKIAKADRETYRRYESYIESKDAEIKASRFDKLVETIEIASVKRKGIWFDLEGFVNKLEIGDFTLVKESIKVY